MIEMMVAVFMATHGGELPLLSYPRMFPQLPQHGRDLEVWPPQRNAPWPYGLRGIRPAYLYDRAAPREKD
jgi:hypothetical protein